MLTVDEYLASVEGAAEYEEWLVRCSSRNGVFRSGLLRFTEDSAHQWSGPFPGDYAFFSLHDCSVPPPVQSSRKGRGKILPTLAAANSAFAMKRGEDPTVAGYPTLERPIVLYLRGNDDTSWSKFYATLPEAEKDLEALLAAEPLDFESAIGGLDFVFTN